MFTALPILFFLSQDILLFFIQNIHSFPFLISTLMVTQGRQLCSVAQLTSSVCAFIFVVCHLQVLLLHESSAFSTNHCFNRAKEMQPLFQILSKCVDLNEFQYLILVLFCFYFICSSTLYNRINRSDKTATRKTYHPTKPLKDMGGSGFSFTTCGCSSKWSFRTESDRTRPLITPNINSNPFLHIVSFLGLKMTNSLFGTI
jgi:hypothetical protein